MKIKTKVFLLLFSLLAIESYSQSKQAFTKVSHNRNNITVRNIDDTFSTIRVNGNSAMLFNSDGTFSTIDFSSTSSTLFSIDGGSAIVSHNRLSSTIDMSDGTQFFVSHQRNSSSYSTAGEKHLIIHTFTSPCETRIKNKIDVLVHMNWYIRMKAANEMAALSEEEIQN